MHYLIFSYSENSIAIYEKTSDLNFAEFCKYYAELEGYKVEHIDAITWTGILYACDYYGTLRERVVIMQKRAE